jgi:hypothetical protein
VVRDDLCLGNVYVCISVTGFAVCVCVCVFGGDGESSHQSLTILKWHSVTLIPLCCAKSLIPVRKKQEAPPLIQTTPIFPSLLRPWVKVTLNSLNFLCLSLYVTSANL